MIAHVIPRASALWARLMALDSVCEIQLDLLWRRSVGAHQRRLWRVSIKRRGVEGGGAVELVRPTALAALADAVDEASARGWDLLVGRGRAGDTAPPGLARHKNTAA